MASQKGRCRRVLVVEDREGIREVFCDFLDLLGHDHDAAADGAEALGLFEDGAYDLVITDLKMPGMSGLELAQTVRERDPAIEVIVISGSAILAEVDRIIRLGFGFLQKPVTLRDFAESVQRALGAVTATHEATV